MAWLSHSYGKASLSIFKALVWSSFYCKAANYFTQFHTLCVLFITVLTNVPEGLRKLQYQVHWLNKQFIYLKWTASGKSDLHKNHTRSSAPQILPQLISNRAHQNTLAMDRAEVGPKVYAATAISQPLSPTAPISPRNYSSIQPKCITLHINLSHSINMGWYYYVALNRVWTNTY